MSLPIYKGLERIEGAFISLHDIGFSRGVAVFDFLRTYNKIPFCLLEHFRRLEFSCGTIGIPIPYSLPEIEKIVESVLEECQEDVAIKLIVTGGVQLQGFLPSNIELYTIALPLPQLSPEKRLGGIFVDFTHHVRQYPQIKSLNYLSASLGMLNAHKKGLAVDDILYVNEKNEVLEASTANLFIVKNNTLITPQGGILLGITRQICLDLARDQNISVEERAIDVKEVLEADEIFLTSTTRELLPVRQVQSIEKNVQDFTVLSKLQKAFSFFIEKTQKAPL